MNDYVLPPIITSYVQFKDNTKLFKKWLLDNGVYLYDVEHIYNCIDSMVAELFNIHPAGDFIKLFLTNDLLNTVFQSDDINQKYLKVYALFLHWYIPMSIYYQWKVKNYSLSKLEREKEILENMIESKTKEKE